MRGVSRGVLLNVNLGKVEVIDLPTAVRWVPNQPLSVHVANGLRELVEISEALKLHQDPIVPDPSCRGVSEGCFPSFQSARRAQKKRNPAPPNRWRRVPASLPTDGG
jgi:hypothetical protein